MGGGKSSGSSAPVVTQEQKDALAAQTKALTETFLPAYQQTIGKANNVYGQANPTATAAANTAMNVAGQTGALQQGAGSQAYLSGLGGQQNIAGGQQGFGQALSGAGAGGVGQLAGYQQGLGQGLTGQGAQGLSSLFGPQYEQNQINAALQSGRESARESQAGQNAMYGGAGGLGSSRMALADQNLASLNAQRQATAAAGAQAQVQANRSAASQALLGAGQTASGQAGNLYGNLLSTGQGATNAAGTLYGNLAGQGSSGLAGANQAAAARIGYAQTPQDVLAKYASVIYGTPQGATTPNFSGTQGQNTSSSGKGFKI